MAKAKKRNDNWRTPDTLTQPVFTLVCMALNTSQIGLDPTAEPTNHLKAEKYITAAEDFLSVSDERCKAPTAFMNPPYSNPYPFVDKLSALYERGAIGEAIALLRSGCLHNAKTGLRIRLSASAFCLWGAGLSSRIAFIGDEGVPVKGADFDCCLVYWGKTPAHFLKVFSTWGLVAPIDFDAWKGRWHLSKERYNS